MGLGDIVSRVITKYEADASGQIAELKKLKDKISDSQRAELEAHKTRQDTYQKWLNGITGVNQGLELASKAIGFAVESWKAYANNVRLTAAAGKADIEALRRASLGLRTEQELLSFAARTQHGVVKASQRDMETAQRAMVALTRAGFDQEEVTRKITEAMVGLQVGGLDDLGISIQKGKTDLETYSNLMAELGKRASGVNEGQLDASEGVQKLGVSMRDSIDKMKIAIGELVVSLEPLLVGLASAVQFIAEIAKGPGKVVTKNGRTGLQIDDHVLDSDGNILQEDEFRGREAMRSFLAQGDVGAFRAQQAIQGFVKQGTPDAPVDFWGSASSGIDEAAMFTFLRKHGLIKDKNAPGGARRDSADVSDLVSISGTDVLGGNPQGFGNLSLGEAAAINVDDGEILRAIEDMRTGRLTDDWNKRLEAQRAQKTSFLESSFGKLEEFNMYREAFDMLTGSVSAGLEAWVSGSMSAGQAFKKFIADALTSLASQMAIEALKHTAYAIGSAAFGDIKGAATHGAAAVAFGAGAAAAAVAAKTLGGNADTPKSGSGGGASAGGDRGSNGNGGGRGSSAGSTGGGAESERPIIFVVGDHFSKMSNRQRRLEAEETVQRALRERDE